jgi:ABC-type multidrug transport system ATPase subunit
LQLSIEDVTKRYTRGVTALRDFSLELKPGVLGLLGPNGAGKTTLMSILATITRATEGHVRWNGVDIARDPDALRSVLGYLPQDFGVYPNLSAIEFLEYLAAIKGLDSATARRRIDELLDLVNLTEARKRPLGGFSGGMRQRVGIAQALLNDPQLLIVDEPTAGLDPEERVRFRNLLSDLSGERIVILSTHIVSDVEATATDIALIAKGTLVVQATPEALLAQVEGKVWEWVVPSSDLPALKPASCPINRPQPPFPSRPTLKTPTSIASPNTAPRLKPVTPHERPSRTLPNGSRRLPRARSPLQLSAHAGFLRLSRLRGLRRTGQSPAQPISRRQQLRVARVGHRPGRLGMALAGRVLHRQKRDTARPRNSRRSHSRLHAYQQKLLHPGQNPEQLRGPRLHGVCPGAGLARF